MKFPDLRGFLAELETVGELVRVSEELSPRYEVAAAIKVVAPKQGKAVLLEKVRGYDVPVVGNLLGSTRRLAIALDVNEKDLASAFLEGRNNPIKPRVAASAPVQEVVINSGIDILGTMPVLTHHERDAGPYFTCAFVVARDPETGVRGLGIHRIQVKDKDKVGIFLGSPPLSDFLARAERQDKPLEIAIVSGADPIMYFTSPQPAAPGVDKYDIAGGLAKAPVELVRCKSVDVEVPANAEFVLEGHIIPHHRETEGPFGESTGYYLTYNNPVARIKVITHRRNPIYHALVPFGLEEPVLHLPGFETDAVLWLRRILPSVQRVHSPNFGVVYVQIDKQTEEDARVVINTLFSQLETIYSKVVVVVDTDVDVANPSEITWALGSRVRPDKDIIIEPDLPGLIIDPSTSGSEEVGELSRLRTRTAKIGIDATKPLAELDKYEKVNMPPEIRLKVTKMLGLSE
jgi:2,5-furandicarboxylate decarboxylase 1